MSKTQRLKFRLDWLILSLLVFFPRLLRLDLFLTADEPLFLEQAREFGRGIANGALIQTLGIGYPGITLAWLTAPVVGLAQTEMGAYVAGRMVAALVTGFLLLVLYGLGRRLVGRWPALLGVALLALDPYSLAYGRLFHIATPLALFMTLAGVSLLLWLRENRYRWLVLTGLWTGLALLTKSTALLLGPMLVACLAGWAITTGRWRRPGWGLRQSGSLLLAGLIAVALFWALWPAMWVDPAQAVALTFGKLLTDQEAGTGNLGFFWLGRFVEDPGPFFYPVAFLLKATPWLLVGLIVSLYDQFRSQSKARRTSISLWLFALTYLIFMTLASKKSVRYLLPAFPAFYLLAGLAFYHLYQQTGYRINRWRFGTPGAGGNKGAPFFFRPVTLGVLSVAIILFTLFYHPYYFTYYNPLFLGWRWAPQTLLVGWGEGLEEAAAYLNTQPQGRVSAWYRHLFQIFYRGQVSDVMTEDLLTADHTVLYINQVQRDIPNPNLIDYFRTRRIPELTVRLAGIDYAWVYPGPVAGFRPDPVPHYSLGGEFGGEAYLLGYDLHPPPRSGQPLIVTLYWRVLTSPPADRFVYLRLVDEQGRIWASQDSPPVMGLWPVRRWQPEMLVEDAHRLDIPPGTPPGTYRLEVGLYDPNSGQPLPAAGQPLGQGGGLLLGEVPVEWQPLRTAPDLPHSTDARLAPNARLIGYGDLPDTVTTGDLLNLRLAWREDRSLLSLLAQPNNLVMLAWRQAGQVVAEQPDPLPLPVEAWGRGATLLSQHRVIVPPALVTGPYELVVMLHTGSDPAGEPFGLGRIDVVAPPHQFDLPPQVASPGGPAQLDSTITLAGYQLERSGQSLDLRLYWQLEKPVTTRYKVFAQLLGPDNSVAVQSDAFPAGGQRPTTGWLPGEIIADFHALPLPSDLPPGKYRLITGLYDPLTGQRLPVLQESDLSVADAIVVTELSLP